MTRYHARWVVPVSAPPVAHGTVVERRGRIVWVGARSDAPPAHPDEDDTDLGDAILLPEEIRLGYEESPRRLTAAGLERYDVPRGDYARLAGIPQTGLAPRIPARLHVSFSESACG